MKRTNRVAWGLAAVLAAAMVGSVGLFVTYQSRLPEEKRWVTLLPPRDWGFGTEVGIYLWIDLDGRHGTTYVSRRKLGFFAVRAQ